MKFIERNLPAVSCFILGIVIVFMCINFFTFDCQAIRQFTRLQLDEVFISVIKIIGIGVIGILFFLLIKKHIPRRYYKRIKILYFALLPFCMCFPQLTSISESIKDSKVIHSICDKSTSNGMTYRSKQLSKQEYDYLLCRFYILPPLPNTAEKIDMEYYQDDFFGDYALKIDFKCKLDEKIDTLSSDKHWTIYERDTSNHKIAVEYTDSRN